MKLQTVLILTTAFIFSTASVIQSAPNIQAKWNEFKLKFNKQYKNEDETLRKQIFENNLNFIENHNLNFEQGLEKYTLEVNHFADLTEDEFINTYMMVNQPEFDRSSFDGHLYSSEDVIGDIPDSVDWKAKGIMTPVKNQGACGSCWAFAATGALEARWNLVYQEIKNISEQELVDCTFSYSGCNGGNPYSAYYYIHKDGIDDGLSYPYTAKYGGCRHDKSKVTVRLEDYGYIDDKEPNKEYVLASLVATDGPVAVLIKMPKTTARKLMFYDGKHIFSDDGCENAKGSDVNHAVTVAGYGTANNEDFWLLKNSWGAGWGNEGYFTLKRNANNYCAIGLLSYFPILK